MAEGPVARIQQLENLERDIATAIQSAGCFVIQLVVIFWISRLPQFCG